MTRPSAGNRRQSILACLVVALFLALASLAAAFNHDEDQYYGASYAMLHGALYRDFIFLQTPLNAWLGYGVMLLSPDNSLWLLRIVQGLIGAATFAIVLFTCNRLTRSFRIALFSAGSMLGCYSFLFATTVFRNDMLPCLFATAAIGLLVLRAQDGAARLDRVLPVAGALLALAASAKVNYLLLCFAPAAWIAAAPGIAFAARTRRLALFLAGGLVGALPTFFYLALNPAQFMWQVVEFALAAPPDWYRSVGDVDSITMTGKVKDIFLILVQGPTLLALAMIVFDRLRPAEDTDAAAARSALLLDFVILFGLIAAIAPTPAWRQYFVSFLPALAMRLAIALDHRSPRQVRVGLLGLALFACAGLTAWTIKTAKILRHPENSIVTRWKESRWIGAHLPQGTTAENAVVALSPHLIVDSGALIHPRFVSGVFVYRWSNTDRQKEIYDMGGISAKSVTGWLSKRPPAAIVTGYENGNGNAFSVNLEKPLDLFARNHGYEMMKSPYGNAILYRLPAAAWKARR
ncbi:hypothetical protein SAMN02927924_00258 [Sphingobium faniae]|nr:hypothetical protein SAMN02927924_00258 [Sphingobium faniae]